MNRLLLTLAVPAALSVSTCFASTDCASPVASITVETGGSSAGYIVTLGSGLSFVLSPQSQNSREVLSMTMLALNTGSAFTARFATNDVNCNRSARRTDLIAVVIGREQTAMTSTTPPASALVTTPRPSEPRQ